MPFVYVTVVSSPEFLQHVAGVIQHVAGSQVEDIRLLQRVFYESNAGGCNSLP